MSPTGALSHEDLLTLAHKVEAAASDNDRDRLSAAATRLFDSLVEHLHAEHTGLVLLPPREERLLARGQARVVDLLLEVALMAQRSSSSCRCHTLAQRLLAHLSLQADHERRAGVPMVGVALGEGDR